MDLHAAQNGAWVPSHLCFERPRNFKKMSISELFSVLRADFDRVEEVLVARDAKHKAENGPLQEKIEVERLMRLQAEQQRKRKEEQCQKGMRAQDCYDMSLKEVKKNGLHGNETTIIEELRNKNRGLELENLKLMELKERWVDDSNAIAELSIRVAELDDSNALAALRIRCSELEDARNNNLATIDTLTVENSKLKKELNKEVPVVVKGELNEMDVCDSAPSQRNKDTSQSPGMENSACL